MRRRTSRLGAALTIPLLLASCGLLPPPAPYPRHVSVAPEEGPIGRGLAFLEATQTTQEEEASGAEWAGNWPTRVTVRAPLAVATFQDVTSGIPAYVHMGLTYLRGGRARLLRQRTAAYLRRFGEPDARSGATVYGWCPHARQQPTSPLHGLAAGILLRSARLPRHGGTRAPWNVPAYPPEARLWPDLDDTALVHAALLASVRLDDEAVPAEPLDVLFGDNREHGAERLVFPGWMRRGSGAYLTWRAPPDRAGVAQDVDLAVNANVLRVLAATGHADAPGFAEATALILDAVEAGRHSRPKDVSPYYPVDFTFHYLVATAFATGPVPALGPATARLARDVEARAIRCPDGTARWGAPEFQPLATAFAVLTLLHGASLHGACTARGHGGPLVEAGRAYLRSTQSPTDGGWPETRVCGGFTPAGWRVDWRSRAVPTAFALAALSGDGAWLSGDGT